MRGMNVPDSIFEEAYGYIAVIVAGMLCMTDLGSVLYQRAINGLGDTLIVAHVAARKIITTLMMPLASIATASSTFVSQNFGAGSDQG